jgi:hypothetical protein
MTETSSPERFPVLWSHRREECAAWERMGCPRTVPWSLLAPHEAQAKRNHDQTLKRLAERGGLCPSEMVNVIEGRRWDGDASDRIAIPRLLELILAHEAVPPVNPIRNVKERP